MVVDTAEVSTGTGFATSASRVAIGALFGTGGGSCLTTGALFCTGGGERLWLGGASLIALSCFTDN